jgi:hypothetical protein
MRRRYHGAEYLVHAFRSVRPVAPRSEFGRDVDRLRLTRHLNTSYRPVCFFSSVKDQLAPLSRRMKSRDFALLRFPSRLGSRFRPIGADRDPGALRRIAASCDR